MEDIMLQCYAGSFPSKPQFSLPSMLHVQGHLLQFYTGSFASMRWRIPLFQNVSQKRILRFLINVHHYYSSWVVQKSRWCKTCEAEIFIQKFDSHFAMFSWLEVERFLYLIKALGVGIRLDWGRQISAHVFINRTQSSLSGEAIHVWLWSQVL